MRTSPRQHILEPEPVRRLQLIVLALLGGLVLPPAQEPRGVAEAISLQVVERDFADELRRERIPFGVLPSGPPARTAGGSALSERLPAVVRLERLQQRLPL